MLWDTAGYRPIQEIPTVDPTTYGIAISHDDSLIASGGSDDSVHLWQAATGGQVAVLTGHTNSVFSVDFNRDDSLVASSGADGTVRLWDVAQRRPAAVPVLNPPGGNEYIKQALFSPDGNYVVAALNRSLTVQWWRVSDGTTVGTYAGHTQGVTSIAFSRDGHTLLSGSLDHTGILWKAQSTFLIQPKPVSAVAFSKDGQLLASGSGPTVTLWDPRRREPVRVLTGGANSNSLSFSPDGKTLAATAKACTVSAEDFGHPCRQLQTLTRRMRDAGESVPTICAMLGASRATITAPSPTHTRPAPGDGPHRRRTGMVGAGLAQPPYYQAT